jgi:DNA transposition AAA+ family ATPase
VALSHAQRRKLLAATLPEAKEVRLELRDYLARTGMALSDFAHRINYSRETVFCFLNGSYSRVSSNDCNVRAAIRDFIAAHPIARPTLSTTKPYDTENARLLGKYFYEALDHGRAYYLYGAPGTQKTYVLQHLIAELNRSEIAKNGKGRRAYYIYVRQGIRSLDLMKRVAESCGAIGLGTVDRILRNLRFDLSQRKVLLVFDEAQHLSIECLETIRELLDQPPHCGLLFAGTHELEEIFTRQALELEQWRSRFHAGQALPGISDQEATEIVHHELGFRLSEQKVQRLIAKSRITDLRHGGRHDYVSARRLFWVIRELQASVKQLEHEL